MTVRITLFDAYGPDPLCSIMAFLKMSDLSERGFPVVRRKEKSQNGLDDATMEAWLEFETEAEAALFKLTHL